MGDCEITVSSDGPFRISGKEIVIKDADGKVFDLAGRDKVALCRCGASGNRPFCDGSHKKISFQCKPAARALPPPAPPK